MKGPLHGEKYMPEETKNNKSNKDYYRRRRNKPASDKNQNGEKLTATNVAAEAATSAANAERPPQAEIKQSAPTANKKSRHKHKPRNKNANKNRPADTAAAAEAAVEAAPEAHTVDDKNRYRYVPDYWYSEEEPKKEEPVYDPSKLVEIVGVRFKENGKVYYFAPMGYECPEGLDVIVETARGIEFGTIAIANKLERPEALVAALRPVVRIATDADKARHDENVRREAEAFELCLEKIAQHGLEMKLIDAEYTFDNSKLTFYFCADGRIDFRELVKSLASVFRTRIELRQIGIRDEAKLLGGLGICGRPFCCSTFLYDFNQVSIRMAKEQNLSLNSAKISGTCGRLMCCLRYECEAYDAEMKLTPKVDSIVKTPEGTGVVIESLPLLASVKVKLGDTDDAPIKQFSRDVVTVIGRRRSSNGEKRDDAGDDVSVISDEE